MSKFQKSETGYILTFGETGLFSMKDTKFPNGINIESVNGVEFERANNLFIGTLPLFLGDAYRELSDSIIFHDDENLIIKTSVDKLYVRNNGKYDDVKKFKQDVSQFLNIFSQEQDHQLTESVNSYLKNVEDKNQRVLDYIEEGSFKKDVNKIKEYLKNNDYWDDESQKYRKLVPLINEELFLCAISEKEIESGDDDEYDIIHCGVNFHFIHGQGVYIRATLIEEK